MALQSLLCSLPVVIVEREGREEVVPDVLTVVKGQLIRSRHLLPTFIVPRGRHHLQSVLMPLCHSHHLPLRMQDALYDVIMIFIGGKCIIGMIVDFALGGMMDDAIGGMVWSEGECDFGGGRFGSSPLTHNNGGILVEADIIPVVILLGIVFIHEDLLFLAAPISLLKYFGKQGLVS